jgi:hypothetical protein
MASIAQSNRYQLRGFLPLAHRAPPAGAPDKSLHARVAFESSLVSESSFGSEIKKPFVSAAAAVCLMEQNRTSSPWLDT